MASITPLPGVAINGAMHPRAPAGVGCRRTAGLPARDEGRPRRQLGGGADPARPPGPARRDHRPGRSQDDHQRPQFRGEGLHGRLRGCELADLGQHGRGPDQPQGPLAGPHRLHRSEERQGLQARPEAGGADHPPARLAPAGGPPAMSTASRCRARCSTSASTPSSTRRRMALASGSGPYFYLPKLESHLEARLWNDVFNYAEEALAIPHGSIKATVLIETLPAAFEMDEIIYELRDHMAGLNCGRWDYIFSFIKTLRNKPEYLLPDRGQVVMSKAFLQAYSDLLIKTCHKPRCLRHGRHGGPDPGQERNPAVNTAAFERVKRRQGAGGQGRPRRHLGRPSRPRAGGDGGVRQVHAEAQPARPHARRGRGGPGGPPSHPRRHADRGRDAPEHPRRRPVHRGVAARPWRGAALQPHGGRRDRRDQPLADLAAAPFRRDARGRQGRRPRPVRSPPRGGDAAVCAARSAQRPSIPGASPRRSLSSRRCRSRRTSRSS
jgi:hypothetical protein